MRSAVKFTLTSISALILLTLPVAAIELSFDSQSVTAESVSAGTPVAWLWTGRVVEGYSTRVELESRAGRSDLSGAVRLKSDRPLPEQSIWALADLDSGELVVDGPAASRASLLELPLDGLERDRLTIDGRRFEALLVRPGVGAWHLLIMDGGAADADGARNAAVTLTAESLQALGETTAITETFRPGDRLLLADPDHLRIWAAALDSESFKNLTSNTAR